MKKYVVFLIVIFSVAGCEQTINPISPRGTEYSVYGPLNIEESPNYIRVHDTNTLLSPEDTRQLDVNMILTNLDTGKSELMTDSTVQFEHIITHNYRADQSIEYDTRYKVFWEDGDGYQDSLITQTTKQSDMTTFKDTVFCEEQFFVELTNIDLEAGERLDTEVGINVGGRWWWTFRQSFYSYNSEEKTLVLGWSPAQVSRLIFCGITCNNPPPACSDFTRDRVRFKFHHIGYMEERETPEDLDLDDQSGLPEQQQVVLSRYGEETSFIIAEDPEE